MPDMAITQKTFGKHDFINFQNPPKNNYPQTWFHYLGGNVSLDGITRDLEAIASANIAGVQLFHGQLSKNTHWSKVSPPIECMSELWESAVKHTALECKRLGLDFTMQNCAGWAMAGGPWISPENAMRDIKYSRTEIDANSQKQKLPLPPNIPEKWRDYKDICVLAFPSVLGDFNPIDVSIIKGSDNINWDNPLKNNKSVKLSANKKSTYWFEFKIPQGQVIRTFTMSSLQTLTHAFSYDSRVWVSIEAILPNNNRVKILDTKVQQSNWQDNELASFACSEVDSAERFRFQIITEYDINLKHLKFYSSAQKNSWQSEAGWTLRSIDRSADNIKQNPDCYIKYSDIIDISDKLANDGTLNWTPPDNRKWTVLRIGHVNKGRRNHPAPPSATGWECDKLSEVGSETHFNGYIGKLNNGALRGGLLGGLLLDSWECQSQTWTRTMPEDFKKHTKYDLTKYLPCVFGYVIDSPEKTSRFLLDWRSNINALFVENFYGKMAKLAKKNNLDIFYETASCDIFPADIFEYYKYADVPMCEFWSPFTKGSVGSLNFKPIKPTASASRIYGKQRVSAEAFTSTLSWDDHWQMWKEIANVNMVEGVTHLVFHTYSHNPQVDFLPPGTSFGWFIGSAFLRGQTWWKYMPHWTKYLARCSYMLERGKPVSDILWYMGDEFRHKPDQNFELPFGFKYDYCNYDGLINRIEVRNGLLSTPDGIEYKALWLTDNKRMRIQSLKKIRKLIENGAVVIGNPPDCIATLSGGKSAENEFANIVKEIWGNTKKGVRNIGKGKLLVGMEIEEAIAELALTPQVKNDEVKHQENADNTKIMWSHRRVDGADIYFVCAPKGNSFSAGVEFFGKGNAEVWDATTGKIVNDISQQKGDYVRTYLKLAKGGSNFVVIKHESPKDEVKVRHAKARYYNFNKPWTIEFPQGWGIDKPITTDKLIAWKDLDVSPEGKAFSGTAKYSTTFTIDKIDHSRKWRIKFDKVDMIADVRINGKQVGVIWCEPFVVEDFSEHLKVGENTIEIYLTSTWFNRLVFDQNQPEEKRKTWTLFAPNKDSQLRESGIIGEVKLICDAM